MQYLVFVCLSEKFKKCHLNNILCCLRFFVQGKKLDLFFLFKPDGII